MSFALFSNLYISVTKGKKMENMEFVTTKSKDAVDFKYEVPYHGLKDLTTPHAFINQIKQLGSQDIYLGIINQFCTHNTT